LIDKVDRQSSRINPRAIDTTKSPRGFIEFPILHTRPGEIHASRRWFSVDPPHEEGRRPVEPSQYPGDALTIDEFDFPTTSHPK
jgi:hypothetical protein